MRLRILIPIAAALALPATASADTLLAPTPDGSQNLTAGGGYLAWAQPDQPAGSGFRLVVRAPDGTVSTPDIPVFEEVPQPSIGTDATGVPRRLLLTYTRAGDAYAYDLRAGREERVTRVSTGAVERSVSVNFGTYAWVRVSGRRAGVYVRTPRGATRRVSADVPRELAFNGSRVAYPRGNSLVIRRVSGEGRITIIRMSGRPESVLLGRYRASWLLGDEVFRTTGFGGSGRPDAARDTVRGERPLPGARSIAFGRGERVTLTLDAEGVKRLSPPPFGSRG